MNDYTKDFSEQKTFISEFNEAKFQIYRLHLIWTSCNQLSCAGRLTEWRWKLDRAWIELSPDANSKPYKKYFEKIEELETNILKAKGDKELYQVLNKKEIFLRCLQDEVGKGSKRKDINAEEID